jgi:hypothetical protein
MIDEAKIGGITPDMFSLSGRCELCPPDFVADLALGVIDQNLALTALDEDDEGSDDDDEGADDQRSQRVHRTGAHQLEQAADRARQAGRDAGENDDRDAVAEAAFGNLLTEPHQEHGAGNERGHSRQAEHEARVVDQPGLRFEGDSDTDPLEDREPEGSVARVLGDLPAAGLAFLLQGLELRAGDAHQLHDDRCRDVRHDAQREDREARQGAAREHVEHAQDTALLRIEEV